MRSGDSAARSSASDARPNKKKHKLQEDGFHTPFSTISFVVNIKIRQASPDDSADWVRLRMELWPDCPGARHRLELAQVLASPGMAALALVDEKLAGFAEVSEGSDHVEGTANSPVPYLDGWYVRPAYRG